jgi:hypothetical protein
MTISLKPIFVVGFGGYQKCFSRNIFDERARKRLQLRRLEPNET